MDRVDYESVVIQDLTNFHKRDELDLNPWYQRRSVWKDTQRAYLINTLLEGKPVPSIYIRHTIDLEQEKSIKEVVDGQQRLRAILDFLDDKFRVVHPEYDGRIYYSQMDKRSKSDFLMTKLSIGYLIGADDSDVIDIFGRINSVSKTLNQQEKRNALYSGDFKQFSLRFASELLPFWRDAGIFSANDISRMNEVQFVADVAMNFDLGMVDFSAKRLDDYYKNNDDYFRSEKKVKTKMDRCFSLLASIPPTSFSDTIFSRPPVLYSLAMILDGMKKKPSARVLEDRMSTIDDRIQADIPISERSALEANFITAMSASTQRINSRRQRNTYLAKFFR